MNIFEITTDAVDVSTDLGWLREVHRAANKAGVLILASAASRRIADLDVYEGTGDEEAEPARVETPKPDSPSEWLEERGKHPRGGRGLFTFTPKMWAEVFESLADDERIEFTSLLEAYVAWRFERFKATRLDGASAWPDTNAAQALKTWRGLCAEEKGPRWEPFGKLVCQRCGDEAPTEICTLGAYGVIKGAIRVADHRIQGFPCDGIGSPPRFDVKAQAILGEALGEGAPFLRDLTPERMAGTVRQLVDDQRDAITWALQIELASFIATERPVDLIERRRDRLEAWRQAVLEVRSRAIEVAASLSKRWTPPDDARAIFLRHTGIHCATLSNAHAQDQALVDLDDFDDAATVRAIARDTQSLAEACKGHDEKMRAWLLDWVGRLEVKADELEGTSEPPTAEAAARALGLGIAFIHDIGGRDHQEDAWCIEPLDDGLLVIVCDGMGSRSFDPTAGADASRAATLSIVDYFRTHDHTRGGAVEYMTRAFLAAHEAVELATSTGGTTCTAAFVQRCDDGDEARVIFGHVGDSSLWANDGRLWGLQTERHGWANILGLALGNGRGWTPETIRDGIHVGEVPLGRGVMLCSDGLATDDKTDPKRMTMIAPHSWRDESPEEILSLTLERARAEGSRDNATGVMVWPLAWGGDCDDANGDGYAADTDCDGETPTDPTPDPDPSNGEASPADADGDGLDNNDCDDTPNPETPTMTPHDPAWLDLLINDEARPMAPLVQRMVKDGEAALSDRQRYLLPRLLDTQAECKAAGRELDEPRHVDTGEPYENDAAVLRVALVKETYRHLFGVDADPRKSFIDDFDRKLDRFNRGLRLVKRGEVSTYRSGWRWTHPDAKTPDPAPEASEDATSGAPEPVACPLCEEDIAAHLKPGEGEQPPIIGDHGDCNAGGKFLATNDDGDPEVMSAEAWHRQRREGAAVELKVWTESVTEGEPPLPGAEPTATRDGGMRHQASDEERPDGDLYITDRKDIEALVEMIRPEGYAAIVDPCASGAAPYTVGEVLAEAWGLPVYLFDLNPRAEHIEQCNFYDLERPDVDGPIIWVSNTPYDRWDTRKTEKTWIERWVEIAKPGDLAIWLLPWDTLPTATDRRQDEIIGYAQPRWRMAFCLTPEDAKACGREGRERDDGLIQLTTTGKSHGWAMWQLGATPADRLPGPIFTGEGAITVGTLDARRRAAAEAERAAWAEEVTDGVMPLESGEVATVPSGEQVDGRGLPPCVEAVPAPGRWIAYDTIDGNTQVFDDEAKAVAEVRSWIDVYREGAPTDGWPDDMDGCCVARVTHRVVQRDRVETPDGPFDYSCDWAIEATGDDHIYDEGGVYDKVENDLLDSLGLPGTLDEGMAEIRRLRDVEAAARVDQRTMHRVAKALDIEGFDGVVEAAEDQRDAIDGLRGACDDWHTFRDSIAEALGRDGLKDPGQIIEEAKTHGRIAKAAAEVTNAAALEDIPKLLGSIGADPVTEAWAAANLVVDLVETIGPHRRSPPEDVLAEVRRLKDIEAEHAQIVSIIGGATLGGMRLPDAVATLSQREDEATRAEVSLLGLLNAIGADTVAEALGRVSRWNREKAAHWSTETEGIPDGVGAIRGHLEAASALATREGCPSLGGLLAGLAEKGEALAEELVAAPTPQRVPGTCPDCGAATRVIIDTGPERLHQMEAHDRPDGGPCGRLTFTEPRRHAREESKREADPVVTLEDHIQLTANLAQVEERPELAEALRALLSPAPQPGEPEPASDAIRLALDAHAAAQLEARPWLAKALRILIENGEPGARSFCNAGAERDEQRKLCASLNGRVEALKRELADMERDRNLALDITLGAAAAIDEGFPAEVVAASVAEGRCTVTVTARAPLDVARAMVRRLGEMGGVRILVDSD